MRPTIVLVHGAFAESASWDGVIDPLLDAGHSVDRGRQPAAGRDADAAAVSDVVRAIDGPVVIVGHSYGGMVISNVDPDAGEIIGLVYVAAFAPEPGDSAFSLAGDVPGQHARRRGAADPARRRHHRPVDRPGALPRAVLRRRAGGRRRAGWPPRSGRPRRRRCRRPRASPLWKQLPSWFVFGEEDRNIPAALEHYMAKRAGAHRTIEIPGASHAVSVAHPAATASLILEAAAVNVAV